MKPIEFKNLNLDFEGKRISATGTLHISEHPKFKSCEVEIRKIRGWSDADIDNLYDNESRIDELENIIQALLLDW